nr:voltage-dependent calcium channel gamma-5 subunit [Drosophila takahashii]
MPTRRTIALRSTTFLMRAINRIHTTQQQQYPVNTVTKSCPIFLAAGVFLVISFIVFLIPTCSHRNNLYYFSAGILFIVSGLVMLIGLIAYISILKAEIGSKLRPRSTLQPALIKVSYGQSFFLFVFGFIVTEFVGVLNIFLFINLQEVSYYNPPLDS